MTNIPEQICFSLPGWVRGYSEAYVESSDARVQMNFVIEASRRNVQSATGGPFAAAIVVSATGELVSLGVNLIPHAGLSALHAEMVAIMLAQRKLGTFDLSRVGPLTLVSTTEPCTMCLGGVCWSGVRHVVTGASDADARAVGFDEGPKPQDWQEELRQRGISVAAGVEAEPAREVLQYYHSLGRPLYNPGLR